MKKLIIILSLIHTCGLTFAQKLTYNDLLKFAGQSTDQSAELLYSKGFTLDFANNNYSYVRSYKSFILKAGSDESIGLEFTLSKDGTEEIQSCFSQKFNADFKKLETQVKTKTKKIRVFFYAGLHRYVTEYKIGEN